jgi:hypothetical protein
VGETSFSSEKICCIDVRDRLLLRSQSRATDKQRLRKLEKFIQVEGASVRTISGDVSLLHRPWDGESAKCSFKKNLELRLFSVARSANRI